MSNIVIYPTSGILEFNTGVAGSSTLDNSLSGASRFTFNSGETNITSYATGNLNRLTIDGAQGRLFLIDDLLSGNLFSVNTIAGLPVIQANSDYTIIMGQYNQNNLVITGGSIGIGGLPTTGIQKLYVSGNVYVSGNIYLSGNSVMTGSSSSFITTGQTGSFYTTSNPSGYITSSNVVYQTGIQTISGVKTFNDNIAANYVTLSTGANAIVSFSFQTGEYYLTISSSITNVTGYTFTGTNAPSSPQILSSSVFIYNTGYTGYLTFPTGWTFMGSQPSTLASGKSALLTVKAYGGGATVAGYSVQY